MLKRHDLLFFSRSCLDAVLGGARCVLPDTPKEYWEELTEQLGVTIPGIVRRQESGREGFVDVGFSSTRRVDGVRYRVSASIPIDAIERVLTPFAVMELALARSQPASKQVLSELSAQATGCNLSIGLLGSQALQAVTGLNYTSSNSDYDLILEGNTAALPAIAALVDGVERRTGITTDIEVRLRNKEMEYDVKLKDYLSSGSWVMGRTLTDVLLLQRHRPMVG